MKFVAALSVLGLLSPTSAFAFACYVGEAPEGDVPLRKKPDDNAEIVAHLERSNMVGDIARVPERNGWIYVIWSKEQSSQAAFLRGKGDGKGWMKRTQIRGECED